MGCETVGFFWFLRSYEMWDVCECLCAYVTPERRGLDGVQGASMATEIEQGVLSCVVYAL